MKGDLLNGRDVHYYSSTNTIDKGNFDQYDGRNLYKADTPA